MARIRSIKPAFFRSTSVADLPSDGCRLTLVGLFTYCDDYGRGVDDARLVKADIWPLHEGYTTKCVEADLASIAAEGTLCRYVAESRNVFHFPRWKAHQKVSHPTDSELPPCPIHDRPEGFGNDQGDTPPPGGTAPEDSGIIPEGDGEIPLGREGKGLGSGREEGSVRGTQPQTPPASLNPTHALSQLLAELVEANGSPKPTVTRSWLIDLETILSSHLPDEVERVIRWCQADKFWRSKVMTSAQLRKQYDRLRLDADAAASKSHLSVVRHDGSEWAGQPGGVVNL